MTFGDEEFNKHQSIKDCRQCIHSQRTNGFGNPLYCNHPDTVDKGTGIRVSCSTARHRDLGKCQPEAIYFRDAVPRID